MGKSLFLVMAVALIWKRQTAKCRPTEGIVQDGKHPSTYRTRHQFQSGWFSLGSSCRHSRCRNGQATMWITRCGFESSAEVLARVYLSSVLHNQRRTTCLIVFRAFVKIHMPRYISPGKLLWDASIYTEFHVMYLRNTGTIRPLNIWKIFIPIILGSINLFTKSIRICSVYPL